MKDARKGRYVDLGEGRVSVTIVIMNISKLNVTEGGAAD